MLFHGVLGGEVRTLIDGTDWRGKSESTTAGPINVGETDTNSATCSSNSAFLCAGCEGQISDRYYLLAVDKQWHTRCLKCSECKLNLASEISCFCKDSSIFCKEDYYRRYSVQRCPRCHLGILASEMVMRARDLVYHLNCFICATCNKMLTTGDHFGMKDGLVYCQLHVQAPEERYEDRAPCKGVAYGSQELSYYYNGMSTVLKGRQGKRKNTAAAAELPECKAVLTCRKTDCDVGDRDLLYGSGNKSKRIRTSFKHHQLRTMKSYFAINHNPDAKDLKQLSQKTGLTKRVLQVWFQNARAKFRRSLLRQESMGTEKASDSSTLPGGSPSGPGSEVSNTSTTPCSTPPATLTVPVQPPTVQVTSAAGGLDLDGFGSLSNPSLTCLF